MRFFIAKTAGNVITDKQCFAGDDAQIDAIVTQFKANHANLTVTEVDQATFDAANFVAPPTPAQQAWATFKAGSPTPQQAIIYLAHYLGLE